MLTILSLLIAVGSAVDTTQAAEDTVQVHDVVITASRLEQRRSEAPVLVTTTDQKVFQAVQAVSLSEGLSFQPGLRLEQNCQNCGFTQVRLNGLQGPYTQILIDSRPVFSSLNGVYGLEQIPASIVDRIEITRGGGSAMYGAGAIAGTINVITREPFQNMVEVSAMPAVIGGTARDFVLNAHGAVVSADYQQGLTLFGSFRDRDWYDRNADGFSELVQLRLGAGGFRGFHYFTPQDRLSIEGHVISEFRRGGEMTNALPEASAITEQLDHLIGGGALTYERSMNNDRSRLSAYASAQVTQRDSYYGGNGGDPEQTEAAKAFYGTTQNTIAVTGLQFSDVSTMSTGRDLLAVTGVELTYDDVNDSMPGYGRAILQTTTDLGAYAQLQYAPGEPLSMTIGARADMLWIDGVYRYDLTMPTEGTERRYFVVNPRATLLAMLSEVTQLRLGYAMGFRGPQAFDEDFHISTLQGAARLVRLSGGLRPERSHSVTLSMDINDRTISKAIGGTVEAFATLLENPFVIALTPSTTPGGGAVAVKTNGDAAYVAGVNSEFRMAALESFEVQIGATVQMARYATAQVVAQGERDGIERVISTSNLLRTPSVYGSMIGSWTPWHDGSVDLSTVLTGPMDAVNERTLTMHRTPWFVDLGVRYSHELHVSEAVTLNLSLGVANLLDVYQRDIEQGVNRDAAYIYGPFRPRTVSLTFHLAYR